MTEKLNRSKFCFVLDPKDNFWSLKMKKIIKKI